MRVVKAEIRNFRLEFRSRDPNFEMLSDSAFRTYFRTLVPSYAFGVDASQRPSKGNSKLSRPGPQLQGELHICMTVPH